MLLFFEFEGCNNWNEFCFRYYLLVHNDIAKEYGEFKLSLLPKYKNNRDGYTEAKTDFIKKYTKKAREEFGYIYAPKN